MDKESEWTVTKEKIQEVRLHKVFFSTSNGRAMHEYNNSMFTQFLKKNFTPVIPATSESEMRRIKVRGQCWQKLVRPPSQSISLSSQLCGRMEV
jgi:hypothetical protein